MKRLIFALAICAVLAACAPLVPQRTAQEIMAGNPSNACFKELGDRPSLARLRAKTGLGSTRPIADLAARTDQSYPSAEDKAAITEYWAGRVNCFSIEANYVNVNYPPGVAAAQLDARAKRGDLLTQLYEGKLTFAQYVQASEAINAVQSARIADAVAQIRAGEEADRQRRAQAVGIALQGFAAQQAAQSAQMQQNLNNQMLMMQMNRSVQTNCQRFGNQTNCTSY